jgi:hypothetical protein
MAPNDARLLLLPQLMSLMLSLLLLLPSGDGHVWL